VYIVERSNEIYGIHIRCDEVYIVYSCGSVAPEELL